MIKKVNRREFLKTGLNYAGTGLVLAVIPDVISQNLFSPAHLAHAQSGGSTSFSPNVFLTINADNSIKLICHRTEIGQGARTSVAMLLAEELDVTLKEISLEQATGDEKYGDQNTDGSTTVRKNWQSLRQAGAAARQMLVEAAAKKWSTPVSQLRTENGFVVNTKTNKKLSYGELAEAASKLPVPKAPTLKDKAQFKLIGKAVKSLDLDDMTHGKAIFGIDISLPGMLYASVERSPSLNDEAERFDEKAALSVKGVKKVIRIDATELNVNGKGGVAVIADNTWAAAAGREKLSIKWSQGKAPRYDSAEYRKKLDSLVAKADIPYRKDGDADAVLKTAKNKMSLSFHAPYAVQAPMEPLAATASVKKDSCEVWAPVQDPQRARNAVAAFLKLKKESVTINVTLAGGGFGRKSQPDFVLEAVQASKAMNAPVKVTWTREDEIKHGYYHAESMQKIDVAIDSKGLIEAWRHVSVFPTIFKLFDPKADKPVEFEMSMGATELPYRIPHVSVLSAKGIDADVRVGWLRSVCHVWHSFAVNTTVNEVAAALKKDPIDYRLTMLGAPRIVPAKGEVPFPQDTKRMIAVINRVRKDAGWGKKLAAGKAQGFANHYSFFSYVAMVVEASLVDGKPKVHDVYCAADCGPVVNIDFVRAQIEGGIAYGLSLALYNKITTKAGVVEQSNFHDYQVLRHEEMPRIHISLIQSDTEPTGIGEPPTPPVAPALGHALAKLKKSPVRDMPFV